MTQHSCPSCRDRARPARCGQCGRRYDTPACGPTHAAISAGVGRARTLFERVADPDDIAIYEAAKFAAAGRKVKFIVILREGAVVAIKAEDGGAL